jgi:hypothetical protein
MSADFNLFAYDPIDAIAEQTVREMRLLKRDEKLHNLKQLSRDKLSIEDLRFLHKHNVERSLQSGELVNETTISTFPDILSRQECANVIAAADGAWTKDRHGAYPTVDVAVSALQDPVKSMLTFKVAKVILPAMSIKYQIPLSMRDVRDLFIVKYSSTGQRELKLHTDGCLLSFNLALDVNFQGGGTYFQHIDDVIKIPVGHVVFHSAKLPHSGQPIYGDGERHILVGFVDVGDRLMSVVRENI